MQVTYPFDPSAHCHNGTVGAYLEAAGTGYSEAFCLGASGSLDFTLRTKERLLSLKGGDEERITDFYLSQGVKVERLKLSSADFRFQVESDLSRGLPAIFEYQGRSLPFSDRLEMRTSMITRADSEAVWIADQPLQVFDYRLSWDDLTRACTGGIGQDHVYHRISVPPQLDARTFPPERLRAIALDNMHRLLGDSGDRLTGVSGLHRWAETAENWFAERRDLLDWQQFSNDSKAVSTYRRLYVLFCAEKARELELQPEQVRWLSENLDRATQQWNTIGNMAFKWFVTREDAMLGRLAKHIRGLADIEAITYRVLFAHFKTRC